jgi:hypothetical protein
MAVLKRPLLPGSGRNSLHAKTSVQIQLPLMIAICIFCFLFGLFAGGAVRLSSTIEPAALSSSQASNSSCKQCNLLT